MCQNCADDTSIINYVYDKKNKEGKSIVLCPLRKEGGKGEINFLPKTKPEKRWQEPEHLSLRDQPKNQIIILNCEINFYSHRMLNSLEYIFFINSAPDSLRFSYVKWVKSWLLWSQQEFLHWL